MAREGVPQEVRADLDPVVGEVRRADHNRGQEAGAGNPRSDNVPEADLPVETGRETQVLMEKVIIAEDHLPSPRHQNVGVVGGYNTALLPEYRSMIFCLSSPHRGRYQRKDPPKRRLRWHRLPKVIKPKKDQVGDRL